MFTTKFFLSESNSDVNKKKKKKRVTPSKILVMDINKGFIEENAMSRKLKITEKTGGGDTT